MGFVTTPYAPEPGDQPYPSPQSGPGQPYPASYYYAQQGVQPPPYWGPPPGYPQPAGPPPQPPQNKGTGKTVWIAAAIAAVIVIGTVNTKSDDSGRTSTAAAPTATPTASPVPAAAPTASPSTSAPYNGYGMTEARYGEQIEAGDLTVTAAAPTTISQEYLGKQVCSTVTYRNTGTTSEPFSMFDWNFRTANGVETSASIPFNAGDSALNSGDLAPGGTTTGKVCGDSQTKNVSAIVFKPGFGIMHEVTFTK